MAEQEQERTEEATQQRRDDFRKRGQVANTRELGSVCMLLISALMLWFMGRFFLAQMAEIVTQTMGSFLVEAARSGDYIPATLFVLKRAIMVAGPFVGILGTVGVGATVIQTGFLNNEEALSFDLEKINPLSGLKRLVSLRAWIEGVKAIVKLIVVTAVVYYLVKDQLNQLPLLVNFSANQLMVFTGLITVRVLGGVGTFMGVLAAGDYFFQRWQLEKQMRMTKQEVKEEHKSREGDPMIKARIRRIQREMANKRMMTDVPKADVVITNPTHIACALQYDPTSMAAPKLIAKGAGVIAEKIKEVARKNNVPVMENKPLARAIFKTLKIGHTVPRELFTAVAQVLSYVYKLKRKVR